MAGRGHSVMPGRGHSVMAGRGHPRWRAAGLTLACSALLAGTALLAAGCGARGPAPPAGHATLGGATAGLATGAQRRALATQYLAIAVAGNHHLETDFNRLAGPDRNNLAAARADLRDAAATERLFDRRLLGLHLPPVTEKFARFLFWVNQARASLTAAAARSTSLRQLHSYELRMNAANRPVEQAVSVIRRQLGLPPPETH